MDSRIFVQSKPTRTFHEDDLRWAWKMHHSFVKLARIPSGRVDDFMDGEGRKNIKFETSF